MRILAADDEAASLRILRDAIEKALPSASLCCASRASEAVSLVRDRSFMPDVAFLDIDMPGMSGLELAAVLKALHPTVNIIFVTAFSSYAIDAMALRPSGYILKPATEEKVLAELQNLRNPPARTAPAKDIRVQCFGSFEVFKNGEPVQFLRAKCKELLAYLVDRRGASCTAAEIAEVLWEDGVYDRSRQKQLSVIKTDLIKSLKLAETDDMIVKSRDAFAVHPEAFDCDYYMALAGDSVSVNTFMGEYMMPYAWAEFTTAALSNKFTDE